ncbi:MAG: hypothetical protein GOV15_02380 [Candidatus Diapherotrites archaeon]|nr:hypothetical protein [Candidatus Diapherotrites archaeon]
MAHEGGDVDPNHQDAVFILNSVNWIMAELVRVLHEVTPEDAKNIVEALITKKFPLVWEVEPGIKRILKTELPYKEKVLVLLYSEHPDAVLGKDLFLWVEHYHSTKFKKNILIPLHNEKLIEYDREKDTTKLSPKGVKFVEENIDLNVN